MLSEDIVMGERRNCRDLGDEGSGAGSRGIKTKWGMVMMEVHGGRRVSRTFRGPQSQR